MTMRLSARDALERDVEFTDLVRHVAFGFGPLPTEAYLRDGELARRIHEALADGRPRRLGEIARLVGRGTSQVCRALAELPGVERVRGRAGVWVAKGRRKVSGREAPGRSAITLRSPSRAAELAG